MSSSNKKRIILDVYGGLDDAYAILFFLYAEKKENLEIVAITCTMGNIGVDNVCRNMVRLLEMVGRTDIPIYRGAKAALIRTKAYIPLNYFSKDGFMDLEYETETDMSIVKTKPASIAMRDIVKEFPKEITLLCLGPLTNVALAIKMFDDFIENVKDVYIMGGNQSSVGHVTPAAKFNFYHDPEAAHIVLETTKWPITVFMYEATIRTPIDMEWRLETLGSINTPVMKLLTEAERKYRERRLVLRKLWIPFDCLLAIAFVYPEKLISRKNEYHVTVELEGSNTRGQMILDFLKTREPNCTLIQDLKYDCLKEMLMESLSA